MQLNNNSISFSTVTGDNILAILAKHEGLDKMFNVTGSTGTGQYAGIWGNVTDAALLSPRRGNSAAASVGEMDVYGHPSASSGRGIMHQGIWRKRCMLPLLGHFTGSY